MKKISYLFLAAIAALIFAGCASGESSIISMDLDGAVLSGEPVIDAAARTVTATVEPVDLSAITPSFELSSNASIGELTLQDGEACTCTVTAEDGSTSEWTITVTVQPGISFYYDGTYKSFLFGVADENLGDGVPYCIFCTTGQRGDWCYGYSKEWVTGESVYNNTEMFILMLSNSSSKPVNALQWNFSSTSYIAGYIAADRIYNGEVGDWIIGSFDNFLIAMSEDPAVTFDTIDGFFKVLRIADDTDASLF